MDYKAIATAVKLCGSVKGIEECKKCNYWKGPDMSKCIPRMTEDAAAAIINLLARAEAAEARVRELETGYRIERCEAGPECVELGKARKAQEDAEARADHSASPGKMAPLTQADIDTMHFERVWIDYGAGGEDGVILYGKLYSIDTLDGAGFEELLLDATGHGGESIGNPSGEYTIYRCPKTGLGQEDARTLKASGGHGG